MLSWNEVQAAVPLMIYCTAALTSFSDSVSCMTSSFLEWCIVYEYSQRAYEWILLWLKTLLDGRLSLQSQPQFQKKSSNNYHFRGSLTRYMREIPLLILCPTINYEYLSFWRRYSSLTRWSFSLTSIQCCENNKDGFCSFGCNSCFKACTSTQFFSWPCFLVVTQSVQNLCSLSEGVRC